MVWVAKDKRGGLNISPLEIKVKEGSQPVHVKWYPLSLEGRRGLQNITEELLNDGLLEPCLSLVIPLFYLSGNEMGHTDLFKI